MRDLSTYPITDDEILECLRDLYAEAAANPVPGNMRTTLLRAAMQRIRRHPAAPERIRQSLFDGDEPQTELDRAAKALIRRGGFGYAEAMRLLMARRMTDYDQAARMTGREDDLERLMTHVADAASEGHVPEAVAFAMRAAGADPAAVSNALLAAMLQLGGAWPNEAMMRVARRLVEEENAAGPGVASAPPR